MNGKEEKMWEDEPQWDDPPPPRPPYVYRPSWADQFPHLVNAATEEDKAQAGRNALEFMQLGGSFRVGRLTTCDGDDEVPAEKENNGPNLHLIPTPFDAMFLDVDTKNDLIMIQFQHPDVIKMHEQLEKDVKTYMDHFGKKLPLPATEATADTMVIVLWPRRGGGEGNFVRAVIQQTLEKGAGEVALCRNTDTWELRWISLERIFKIPPNLKVVPLKAQGCRLKGLEFWKDAGVFFDIFHLIPPFRPQVVVTEYSRDSDGTPVVELEVVYLKAQKRGKPKPPKVKTLNEAALAFISRFTRLPERFTKGQLVIQSHIVNMESTGRMWVFVQSGISKKMYDIGENPTMILSSKEYNKTHGLGAPDEMTDFEYSFFVEGDERFLARYLSDRKFYRVEVLEYARGDTHAKVFYTEFGNTEMIPVKDIIPAAMVDPALGKIPIQIFRAQLSGIEKIENVDKFFEYISVESYQEFYVTGFTDEGIPILDAYCGLLTDSTGRWTYVNQFIVDKGLAEPCADGIKQGLRLDDGRKTTPDKAPARNNNAERKRYMSSCRILDSAGGTDSSGDTSAPSTSSEATKTLTETPRRKFKKAAPTQVVFMKKIFQPTRLDLLTEKVKEAAMMVENDEEWD